MNIAFVAAVSSLNAVLNHLCSDLVLVSSTRSHASIVELSVIIKQLTVTLLFIENFGIILFRGSSRTFTLG